MNQRTLSPLELQLLSLITTKRTGRQVAALYRRRWRIAGAGWSDELRGAAALYLALPFPGYARWVLAVRATGGRSGGPLPTVFALGGASTGRVEVVPGIAVGAGRRAFPLRGYPVNTERFTRVTTGMVELRVPLFHVGRAVAGLPIGIDRLSLSFFGEVGGGWRAGETVRPARYRDVGAELVADTFLGYDFRLRLRGGVGVALADGLGARDGDARIYVAVGTAF